MPLFPNIQFDSRMNKWVAEIHSVPEGAEATTAPTIWKNAYDSKEEAQEAVQREINMRGEGPAS